MNHNFTRTARDLNRARARESAAHAAAEAADAEVKEARKAVRAAEEAFYNCANALAVEIGEGD